MSRPWKGRKQDTPAPDRDWRDIPREALIEKIAAHLEATNPGWNTAPARREIAELMLEAMPTFVTKLDDGSWTAAVGRYTFDKTMETLNRVSTELMAAQVEAAHTRVGPEASDDD